MSDTDEDIDVENFSKTVSNDCCNTVPTKRKAKDNVSKLTKKIKVNAKSDSITSKSSGAITKRQLSQRHVGSKSTSPGGPRVDHASIGSSLTEITNGGGQKKCHPSTVNSGQILLEQRTSKRVKIDNVRYKDYLVTESLNSYGLSSSIASGFNKENRPSTSEPIQASRETGLAYDEIPPNFSSVETSQSETEVDTSANSALNSSAPQYLSNESVSDDEGVSAEVPGNVIKRVRGVGKEWIFVQNFDDPKMANEVLADFKVNYQHKTSTGLKKYFCCKYLQCPAMIQIIYTKNTTVLLQSSDHEHNTTTSSASSHLSRIPNETKSKIKELRDLKLKPKSILSTMRKKYPELAIPTVKQLYGLNSRDGKGPTKISLGELEQWLKDRSAIPEDEHSVFVVHYETDYDAPSFRFFLSTKNLIKQSSQSNIVHADATYKLNYEGFPVLVIGTTDLDRHLHPSGISVCTDEKTDDYKFIFQTFSSGVSRVLGQSFKPTTLVADGAEAIHNGFTAVFGLLLIIMCWAHVKRAIQKRYRSKPNLDEILTDLDLLQLSPSIEAFHIALKLFLEKWKGEEEFIGYFKEQWVDHNGNWFEGVQKLTPKTDNALEGKNKWIKDSHTLRERLPLTEFLNALVEMVNDWSCEYIQDKVFVTQPTIDLPLWTKAYQWVKLSKRVTASTHSIDLDENEKVYSFKVPSSNFDTIVEFDLNHCKSLDEFKKFAFAFYSVDMPSNNWRKGTCTCPSFYKKFICKHLVGMAMRYKLVEPPLSAKSVPIGQKRKRGRPKKAKNALLVA